MRFSKNLLDRQIEVFLAWALRHGISTIAYHQWLAILSDVCKKEDVEDIQQEDVDYFMRRVYARCDSEFLRKQASRAISSLIRFYMARAKNVAKRPRGKQPLLAEIEMAQEYRRKKKLSLAEIGVLLRPSNPIDKSQIHRWLKYPLR